MNAEPEVEKLRSRRVPRCVWNYIDQLKADYAAITTDKNPSEKPTFLSTVASKFYWSDLFALEAAILRIDPSDNLRRVVWRWRARFRAIAGDAAYQVYADSKPPDAATAEIEIIRADMGSLASEIHYLYLLSPAREYTRDQFYLWSFAGIAAVVVIVGSLALVGHFKSFPALAVVGFAGWTGGLISVQERLQRLPEGDPLYRQLQLSSSRWSILLAPLSGVIFAIVLYMFFAGALVNGTLFPSIATVTTRDPRGMPFGTFSQFTGPELGVDWAKLIVWSFIAGFAERLIPDMINRLATDSYVRIEPKEMKAA